MARKVKVATENGFLCCPFCPCKFQSERDLKVHLDIYGFDLDDHLLRYVNDSYQYRSTRKKKYRKLKKEYSLI